MTNRWGLSILLAGLAAAAHAEPQADAHRSVRFLEEPASPPPAVSAAPAQPSLPPAEGDAGVHVEVLPQREFAIGALMTFRVTAKKPGFLVLVDVNSQGKLQQIYPNMITFENPKGVDERANFLRPGQSITLPVGGDAAGFRFVASAPSGIGMVVAILSDAPVQIVDLPDVPPALAGRIGAADYVKESTRSLEIIPALGGRPPQKPHWTFATVYYAIK